MTLNEAKDGQKLVVTGTLDDHVTCQALRFGIQAGSCIVVAKNISGGPVVILKNQLEIAIGRQLSKAIEVTPV